MARRKVTMLEAFEVSARESQQRERTEQRRLAAERDRASRRGETEGQDGEARRSLVGSLLSSFRGDSGRSEAPVEGPGAGTEVTSEPESEGAGAPASSASTLGAGAIPIDRRPPRASSWEAPPVLPEASAAPAADAPATEEEAPSAPAEAAEDAAGDGPALGDTPVPEVSPSEPEAEPAEPAEFSIPMSTWSFAALVGVALAAVFAIGLTLGGALDGDSEEGAGGADGTQEAGFSAPLSVRSAATGGPSEGPASGPEAPSVTREQAPAPAPAQTTTLSAAERKFLDPATKVTVLAITYDESPGNVDLAFEAYESLIDLGLPAMRPYPWDGRVFVFVGGGETRDELEGLLRTVRAVRHPRTGAADFRSAYLVNTSAYRR